MTRTTKVLLIVLGVLVVLLGAWFLIFGIPEQITPLKTDLELAQVTVAIPSDTTGIYPEGEDEVNTFQINRHMFEPLVTMDRNMEVVPALASSWTNPDDETWLFTLRQDVKFHNGKSLTADDVKFTIDKALEEEMPSTIGYLTSIDSVKAVDDQTVQIKTAGPNLILLNQLAQVLILPKTYKEGDDPNGTGPYKFESYQEGKSITMVANDSYYGGAPKVKKAIFRVIESEDDRIAALKSGTADIGIYGFEKDATQEIESATNLDVRSVSSVAVSVMLMNQAEGDLAEASVRQGLRQALNLNEVSSKILSGANPASQLVSRLIFGYNQDVTVVNQDLEAAKSALSGVKKKMVILDMPGSEEPDNEIVAEFKEAGVTATVSVLDPETLFATVGSGEFDFLRVSFSSDTGDAFDVLANFVHSPDEEGVYGGFNFGYENADADKLIEESSQTLDQNTRQEKLQQAMKIAMDEAAVIPLYITDYKFGVRNNIVWEPRPTRQVLVFEMAGKEVRTEE